VARLRELDHIDRKIVLEVARAGKVNVSNLIRRVGFSRQTVYLHVERLMWKGFLEGEKGGFPLRHLIYLTDEGFALLQNLEAQEETEAVNVQIAVKELKEYYARRFRRLLLHLDLARGFVTPQKSIATLGLLPLIALVKASLPRKEADVYNHFLADVYVQAADKKARIKDEELLAKGMTPILIETLWRLATPKACRNREMPLPGYGFNFPAACDNALREELKPLLAKAFPYVTSGEELRKAIFARLKVISHPVRERRQVADDVWLS